MTCKDRDHLLKKVTFGAIFKVIGDHTKKQPDLVYPWAWDQIVLESLAVCAEGVEWCAGPCRCAGLVGIRGHLY